jgi:hypothetical protein
MSQKMEWSTKSYHKLWWVAIFIHMQVSWRWEQCYWALVRVVLLLNWATIIIHMLDVPKNGMEY